MIGNLIKQFVKNYQKTRIVETKWKEPLVAYADALDKQFLSLKEIVSPSHALPQDFLPDAKTVVTYFIPFDDIISESNVSGKVSSKLWSTAYKETNQLIHELNVFISIELKKSGFSSTIIPATHNFDKVKLISDWSHRHVAYIAGLGGFGLNNMLITDMGCCGRVGSLVTNLKLEPTERTGKEYCLYKYNGSCKKCIDRCVNRALTVEYYDRNKCYEACLNNDKMGLADVCGKCLVGLPCSSANPVKLKNNI